MTTIDALDADLIAAVSADPRVGITELAKELGVARNTVAARLGRLEDAGVIDGFTAHVDLAALGLDVVAFVDLELAQNALAQVIADLEALPNVLEVHATTGRGDLLARVATVNHAELQQLLQDILSLPGVNRITTHMALTNPVRYRVTPLLRQLTTESGRGRSGRS